MGKISPATTGGLFLAYWIIAAILVDLVERLRPLPAQNRGMGGSVLGRARLLPRAMIGMMVAHAGVAMFAFGVAMVKTYETERDVKMGPDASTDIAGFHFRMLSVKDVQGPNYSAARGLIEVSRAGTVIAMLAPEKRIYKVQSNPMTEAAVDSNLLRDLYISMGEQLPTGEWIVRVQHKPFIAWIWSGCLVMMLGGGLAASDRRYRARQTRSVALPAGSVAGGAR
jgi:cytochrome c-type biogenesis protein CcmF